MTDHQTSDDGDRWLTIERWLRSSEWIIDAIDRRIARSPAFDPQRALDLWAADRELLIEIMTNTVARTADAVQVKMRALLESDLPTGGLAVSAERDRLALAAAI